MATITVPGMFLDGDHASLPAANAVGKGSLYACSDHTKVYQSDGSTWSDWFDPTGLAGSGSTGLLGITAYRPGADGTIRTFTTTDALVDGTNLTVAFTAPVSGNVLVRFTGTVNMASTAGTEQYWTLWEGGALVGNHRAKVAGPSNFFQVSAAFYVTGIAAGAHTYQWAGYKVSANAALLSGGPTFGAAVMEVWSA